MRVRITKLHCIVICMNLSNNLKVTKIKRIHARPKQHKNVDQQTYKSTCVTKEKSMNGSVVEGI